MGSLSLRRFGSRALFGALFAAVLGFGGLGTPSPAGAVAPPGSEGVVVDGWGGLHVISYGTSPTINSFTSVDYWKGWDIVRGVALRAANPTTCASFGGYTLDGWGGLHPFGINGSAPPSKPTDGPYWKGWDIARNVALVPVNPRNADSPPAGGFVLDGFGGLHYFTIDATAPTPVVTGGPYWPGWDIARGVIILTDPTQPTTALAYRGGYVIDAWGGMHPFAVNGRSPDPVTSSSYWPGWQIVRGGTALPGSNVNGGFTLDAWGAVHPFVLGSGPGPSVSQVSGGFYAPGWDIARGISMKQKKVCP